MNTRKRRKRNYKNRIASENKSFFERQMMKKVAEEKRILDAGGHVIITSGNIPAMLIRHALGFFGDEHGENVSFDTKVISQNGVMTIHGEILCDQDLARLLLEHKDLFQDIDMERLILERKDIFQFDLFQVVA